MSKKSFKYKHELHQAQMVYYFILYRFGKFLQNYTSQPFLQHFYLYIIIMPEGYYLFESVAIQRFLQNISDEIPH